MRAKPKRPPTRKKRRRIAINRRRAVSKGAREIYGALKELKMNDCFMAGFDEATAPHGPKCICLLIEMGMLLLRQFMPKQLNSEYELGSTVIVSATEGLTNMAALGAYQFGTPLPSPFDDDDWPDVVGDVELESE